MRNVGSLVRRAVISLCLLLWSNISTAAEDADLVVDRFLSRLGLVDLRATHLEQMVARMPPGEDRRRNAERLADLYSAQLVARSENKSAYDEVLQRIQRLMQQVPEAKTASLEVMLLQADYFRAETLMGKWVADRSETAARDEAAAILSKIAPQLDLRQQQLNATVEKMSTELDSLTKPDEQSEKLQELTRVQTVAGRASFFAAWANYYLGLTASEQASRQATFVKARDLFRQILGVDGSYKELDASGLGLESIWRARTLIGLGLAEAAQGNLAGSQECFDLLDRSLAPADLRELSPYWRLQALLNAGSVDAALEFAESQIASFSGAASQGRVSFCIALVRAGFGGAQPTNENARKLGMLGITGLIKLRQQSAVRQLIEKYRIPVDSNSGFHLAWLHGQQLLETAEKSKKPEDYVAAASAFETALAASDAKDDLSGSSQCLYQLGWCLYKTDQFERAAAIYQQAFAGLKATDAKTAAEAAWMQFICFQTLSKDDRKFVQSAINILRQLQRDFPDHSYAKRAEYYIGKLQRAALPVAETIANLERVSPSSPDYLSARFDICQLLYEQWANPDERTTTLSSKISEAVRLYLDAPKAESEADRFVRVLLIGTDLALNSQTPDEMEASRLLTMAQRTIRDQSTAVQAEYHYRAFQLATRRNDADGRRTHAAWIVENASGSPFELPALVVAAKSIDDQVTNARTAAKPELLQEARQIYQRLSSRLGDDPSTLKAKTNAQVSVSRLAHYMAELGEHEAASAELQKLLNVFPNNAHYLRRAGLSAFQAGKFESALEHWRKLATGLADGSDEWYEAKYYQLASLARLDKLKARDALAQFRLLYPDLGPPAWRDKFGELQQMVE